MPLRLDFPIRTDQGRFVANEQDTAADVAAGVLVRMVTPPGMHPNGDPGFGVGDPTFRSQASMDAWIDAAIAQQERGHIDLDHVIDDIVGTRIKVAVTAS